MMIDRFMPTRRGILGAAALLPLAGFANVSSVVRAAEPDLAGLRADVAEHAESGRR